MRESIERSKTNTSKKALSVTVSLQFPGREGPNQSIMEVIHAADKALYKAKEAGRNQVKWEKLQARRLKRNSEQLCPKS